MKKSLLVLLSLFTLLLTGCDSWMSEDNFFTNIEKDVKVANASKISVYVRYAQTKQGKTDPEGYTTFKVKIPQSVTAVTEQEYGFVKWAAFSTDFLATGDKQSQNKDVIFVDEKTYNEKLAPKEIKSSIVSFEDPTSPTTNVTINEVRNDIFLVPIVANRPKVELSIPAGGEQNVIRNRTILINFSKPMDEESFYTTDGVFDKISITQGNLSFTADGDIEIKSDDITSHFKTPKFSKTKQMITLEFEDEYKDEGFEAQSSISITISRDVKDSSGYTMTDDMVISFTVGNQKDSLAPSINWLSGGVGENFQDFQGMYNTTGARESLGQKTKIKYEGSDDAPKDNLDAEFYSQFINNRVANSVVMRVFAEDLAGSGSGQSIEGLESSVAQVAIRARHLYNEDGTPDTESIMSQPKYEIYSSQFNNTSFKKSYRELVRAANEKIEDQNDILDETHGSLYEYDLSSFPDGLIQIDVAAIDNVSNNGFFDGGLLASEYGNGWASLFVVKDTTAPDAEANRSKVLADKAKALYGFFNASLFKDIVIIQDANNLFTDANNPKLASANAHIKWIVNPGKDKTWADSLTAEDTRWKLVSESISFTDVPLPEKDGPADFTYVLMDDMGNISKAVALESIIYDNTVPTVGKLTWELDPGITLGVITGTVLDRQTLVIPVTDETSGLKTIDISIGKVGTDGKPGAAYATPFANSGLKVYIDNQELVQGTDYEISGTKLTLIEPNEPFDSKIRIRGLQISDSVSEGSFVVEVNAIDAAFNKDVSKRSSRLENDSTSPVIEKICVPEIDIKRGIEPSVGAAEAGQNEYWADYTKLDTTSINPKANIYITLKEDSSGVKIFDFDSSTIKLTSSSELYVLESGLPAGEEPEAIECDIDTFNNKLTITNNEDAVLSPLNGSITVKITNVELSEKAARVNLSLYDIATNKSLDAEGSKFTLENANDTQISEFMYDKVEPVIKADSFYLRDRQLLAGSKPAEDGYTNEIYVDTGIEIEQGTPTGSGVYKITVDGAEFVKTGADKTTISVNAGGTDLAVTDFEISSDNKTITFTNTDNSCFTAFKNSYVISIKNLKLPQDDGNKIVTIKVTSIGGKESDVHTKSIILDTASPQWNSDGLYAYKDTGIDAAKVYPHPSADSGSKAYGIKLSQDAQELYFYTASKIAIAGDISDINLNPQHLSITKTSGTISSNTAANNSVYNYTLTSDCTFTAYAYDKAGNKSTDITFHIVKDDLFAASPASIDEYMTLTMPQNGAIFRNALPSLTNYNQTGFDYVDSSASASAMKAYNYVIKQNTSTYTLKIKLGSGINASDKNLVGETPAAKQTYEELYATGTSSPIEYYSISHWYGTYNSAAASAAYVPLYPEASSKPKWHSYTKSSSRYSDVDVASYIDSNGDIVIELPKTKNCPPLALLLKDGCGNTTYRMIKPVSMTDNTAAVAWIVDGVIGIGDNKQGRETFIYPSVKELASTETQTQGAVEIGNKLYMLNEASSPRYHEEITEHSGTSEAAVSGMVKNTVAGVTYYNQSVFGTLPKLVLEAYNDTCFYAEPGAGSENEYTLKSRILAVPASAAAPTRSDFIAAADSTRASDWKYVKTSSTDSAIYMVHDYPTFDSTTPYKIYYIVEDTVGNYEINTIVNGDANDAYTLWMYDNVSPTAVLKTAARVNTIEGINYYSANSDIQADVTDSYSGIRSIESTVYNFENQQTHIVVSGLSSKIPAANGNLLIEEIKDFTGNISTNIPLQNNQSTSWIKQIAPTLSTGTANETVITPDTDAYFFEAPVQGSTATGLTYNVKGDRYLTRIDVNLRVDRHDSEQLLGWLVTHSPIAEEDFLDFYPQDYDGIQTFEGNVYSYEKSDNSKTWDEVHNDTYFYAINRAGLICRAPIAIHFVANPIPKVVGNITYEGVVICETETPKVNYTKENSKVIFATKNNTAGNPTICRIYYDANTYTDFTLANYKIDDDENGNPIYAVPLGAASGEGTVLQNLFNDTLRMYLRTASDQESDEYQLLGNGNNNKWTFDQTAPVYTLVSVTDFNNTQKIQNGIHFLINNPTIKFNINDADIDHYKYEIQDVTAGAEYTDITSSIANIMRTENPISMTYLLNTPEELKTYNFRAIDRAKNESIPITINIQKDATPPVGIIGYTLKDQNGQTADLANNTTYGTYIDYTTAQSAGAPSVSTIIYNPAYVKTIDLSPSVNDGTGIGIADSVNDYLFFKIDGGAETAYAGTITLNASWNNKTYEIVAKDKLGNSTVLKKFIFTAHGTIPNVTSENTSIEYPELAAAPQYNGHTIAGFGNDTEHFSIASVARQILTPIASDGTRTVWKFNSNPSITLPVDYSSLPSKVLYYSFTYNNVDEPLTPAEWRRANDVSGGSFIAVLNAADLEEIKSRQTFIFVWYKDEVGNITVHNLTHPGEVSQNWWTTEASKNITAAPRGNFEYVFQNQDGSASTEAGSSNFGTFFKTDNDETKTVTVTYNPAYVKTLALSHDEIQHSGSGLPTKHLFFRIDASTALDPATFGSETPEDYADSITLGDNWNGKKYEIVAVDNIGHAAVLKTFIFTAHGNAPDIASKADVTYSGNQATAYAGVKGFGTDTNYTVSTVLPAGATTQEFPSVPNNQKLIRVFTGTTSLTLPVTASSLPSTKLYYTITYDSVTEPSAFSNWTQVSTAEILNGKIENVAINLSNVSLSKDNPSYIFIWYKDEISNVTKYNLTYPQETSQNLWMTDTTNPSGTITWDLKDNDNTSQEERTSTTAGAYFKSESGTTITITYNPALIKKLVLSSQMTDAGVGLDNLHLYSKVDGSALSTTAIDQNVIDLTDITDHSTRTYEIYAKDHVGHISTLLKTFVFKPHGTVPVVPEEEVSYSGITTPQYKTQNVKGFAADTAYETPAEVPYITDNSGTRVFVNSDSDDSVEFTLPVAELPSNKMYYAVQYYTADNIDDFDAPVANDWIQTTFASGASATQTVTVDLNQLSEDKDKPTFIFVWYKDEISNICVHNLTYHYSTDQGDAVDNGWMWDNEGPVGSLASYNTLWGEDEDKIQPASSAQPGTYTLTESGDTVSIGYSPTYIKQLKLTSGISDSGVGLFTEHLYYQNVTENGELTRIEGSKIEVVTNNQTGEETTYYIIDLPSEIPDGETDLVYDVYAKDRVGNISTRLKRFRFKPHSSVPQITNEVTIPYTNWLVSAPEYNSAVIKGFGSNSSCYYFEEMDEGEPIEYYDTYHYLIATGAKLTLPVDATKLPSDYLWCAVTYNSVDEPVLDSSIWQRKPASEGKISGVPIDTTKITSSTTFIFVWYMDELGNISVHALTNPENTSKYLWTRSGVHNVTYLPLGAVTGRPQNQDGNNATVAGTSSSGDYLESNTSQTNFIYNPETVKSLKLDLTSISSNSGAGFEDPSIFYRVGDSTELIPFAGTTGVTANNFGEITLGQVGDEDYDAWKAGKTYRIVAKDKLGFTNIIKTFVLMAHESVPQASEQDVEYDGTAPTYNSAVIKGFDGTNYSVSTTSSVGISEIQEDLGKIKVFTGATSFTFPVTASSLPSLTTNSNKVYYAVTYNANEPSSWQGPVDVSSTGKISDISINLNAVSPSKASPSYIFVWYKDEIGNISVHNLTNPGTTDNRWMADTTAPSIAETETCGVKAYSITGNNAVDSTTGDLGTYYTSDSTVNGKPKTTVTYNPAYVNKITLTSGVADAGVGLDTYHLYYKQGSSYVLIPNNEITLGSSNVSYEIYSKDRVGHVSELLKTFEFVAHGTVPSVGSGNETATSYSGVTTAPCYNSSEVKSFDLASGSITNSDNIDISSATDSDNNPINVFINNTVSTFTLPMSASSLPSTKLYYAVQYYTKENISSFAEPAAADWTSTTVSSSATTIDVDVSPAYISTSINEPTFIFVWYRDQVGNISVHNVPYAGCLQNMWMKDGTAPTGALNNWTLKKANNSSAAGASATASGDYLETASGSTVSIYYNPDVVKTITFTPAASDITDNENGVGLANDYLWYSTTQGGTTSQITNKTITLAGNTAQTFYIYAQDKVGNKSALLKQFTFTPKTSGPTGSVTGTPKTQAGEAVTLVTSSSNTSGDYIVSGTTYTYNPVVVKKFVLDASGVSDSVVGVTTDSCLWYKAGTTGTLTNGSEITLPQSGSATYYVYAKDKVGNISSDPLATFTFVAHSAKPSATDEGSVTINGTTYNTFGTNTDFTVSSTVGNIAENTAEINVVTAATTFTLPVTAGNLPSARLYYSLTYNSVDEPSIWSAPVNVSSGKLTGIQIALNSISDSKDEPTYIYVWYKDEIGNVSVHSLTYPETIRNLWMKDSAGPTGTVTGTPKKAGGNAAEADDTTYGDYIVNENTITYNPDVVTKIALGDTDVSDAGVGFINGRLWYKAGADGELTNGTEISLSEVTSTTTYYVYAKDRVGNISSDALGTFTLVPDSTAPALKANGAITGTPKKANGEAATEVTSESTTTGDYIKTTSGSTVTISYNPSVVKKFALNAADVEDAVAGLTNSCLWYKAGTTGTLTNGSEITLPASGETTYYIYAKDKLGNESSVLATFVFKAYATAPAAGTGKTTNVTYAGVASGSTPSVQGFVIGSSDVTNTDGIKVITESSNNIEVFTTDTTSTFTLPVVASALPSTKLYYAIQYLDKDSITSTLTAPTTGWSQTTVANDATSVDIAIASTSVSTSKAKPSFIFVWYKDELGNAGVYNIAFPRTGENDSTVYHNLWMKDTAAPTGTVGGTPQKLDGEFIVSATNVADATSGIGDYIVSTSEGTVTYRYNPSVVTQITLSTSEVTEDGVGIEGLYISTKDENDAEVLTKITGNKITLSGNTTKTYKIKAKDKVGHTSGLLTAFVFEPDSLAPDGNVGYFLKNSSAETVTAHTNSAPGVYHVDTDSNTNITTITYNPAIVKTIAWNPSIQDKGGLSESDAGVGLPQKYLFFKIDDSTTLTDYSETITLGSNWDGKKYTVIAKDKVGNESTKITLVFKAHGTAPATTTQAVTYTGTVPKYNGNDIAGFGTGIAISENGATEVTETQGETQVGTGVYKLASGVTFDLPVTASSLPTGNLYYALSYNSVTEPSSWTKAAVSEGKITGVAIDLDKVKGSSMYIFVWFKSELGNTSVYNLTYPGTTNNKWTKDGAATYDPMTTVTYGFKDNAGVALQKTDLNSNIFGYYFVNNNNKIIYNKNKAKKLVFITEANTTLQYKLSSEQNYATMTNNEIDISGITAETTYKVKATDGFGNTSANSTSYTIVPDGTAPSIDSNYIANNKIVKVADGTSFTKKGTFTNATDNQIGNGYTTVYYTSGSAITVPTSKVTDTNGIAGYKFATPDDENATITDETPATSWTVITSSDNNYEFILPAFRRAPHKVVAFFIKDMVGNELGPYYLREGQHNMWWNCNIAVTANDISITSNPTAYSGDANTVYDITVALPPGTLVNKVEFDGCSLNSGSNINFSNYDKSAVNWNGSNANYVNISNMTMKLKLTSADAKIKVNGVSKRIFPSN